jgi:hypothetical protein
MFRRSSNTFHRKQVALFSHYNKTLLRFLSLIHDIFAFCIRTFLLDAVGEFTVFAEETGLVDI